MIRAALLAVALAAPGCAYRVTIASAPAGAQLTLPDGSTPSTPAETTLRWRLFGRQLVTATAPGYRPLTVDLRRSEVRWLHYPRDTVLRPNRLTGAPRGHVELILVPDHGPTGTWTADDVP